MAYLLITFGEEAGRRFDLHPGPVTVGRSASSDIRILDPRVSRRQFLLRDTSDQYILVPLESRNGVHVNGRRITEPTALHDRDKIQIGDTILRFRANDYGDQPAPDGLPLNEADRTPDDDVTLDRGSGT